MLLSPAVFSTDVSEMMIELVNYDVGIVQVFLAGDVDRLVPVNIAS